MRHLPASKDQQATKIDQAGPVTSPLIIKHKGTPIGALIPLEDYALFAEWRAERAARRMWVSEHDPRRTMPASEWHDGFVELESLGATLRETPAAELSHELGEAIRATRLQKSGLNGQNA
jgi:hypothetical protein